MVPTVLFGFFLFALEIFLSIRGFLFVLQIIVHCVRLECGWSDEASLVVRSGGLSTDYHRPESRAFKRLLPVAHFARGIQQLYCRSADPSFSVAEVQGFQQGAFLGKDFDRVARDATVRVA